MEPNGPGRTFLEEIGVAGGKGEKRCMWGRYGGSRGRYGGSGGRYIWPRVRLPPQALLAWSP